MTNPNITPTNIAARKIHDMLAEDSEVYIPDDDSHGSDVSEDDESVATDAEDDFDIVSTR